MLIATTSSSSAPVLLNPALTLRPKMPSIGVLSATTSGSSSVVTPSPASSSKTSTSGSTPKSDEGRPHGGGGGGAAASAASEVETVVGTYSTTVSGTQYAGSVEEEGGSYEASVPNVSGATASGATMIEAENNLTVRIDELV